MVHLPVHHALRLFTCVSDAILNDFAQCTPEDIDSRHQSGAEEDMVQTRSKFIQDPRRYDAPMKGGQTYKLLHAFESFDLAPK